MSIVIFDELGPLHSSVLLMFALLLTVFGVIAQPVAQVHQVKTDSVFSARVKTDTARQYVQIGRIIIIGNERTKKQIILREMKVQQGDTYDLEELQTTLDADKEKILNTQLFHTVKITVLPAIFNSVDLLIEVTERWYIFPVPIFELVDRNFNDWWQNQDRDFSRVNYGLKLYQNNTRGRNEKLKLTFQLGYTRRFGVSYDIPYIDKARRHGLMFLFDYTENKNVAYLTREHKPQFLDDNDPLRIERRFGLGYRFRNNFYTTHSAFIVYNNNDISDTLLAKNPEYFLNSSNTQKYLSFTYVLRIDHRDYTGYPLQGYWFQGTVSKLGLGIHHDVDKSELYLQLAKFSDLGHKFYLSNYTGGFLSTPNDQPYSTLSSMGYEPNLIRGYELYLIEGQHFFLNKTTFKKQLLSKAFYLNTFPVKQFRYVPFAIYLKTFFDFGYVKNYNNYEEEGLNTRFANKLIFGTGVGVDIVTAYDVVIRLEYSVNEDRESGFFFHFKKEF